MSVNKTMNTGVSGLTAAGNALGVVGDNVANVNTVGFKLSRAAFEDVLGGVAGARAHEAGSGVRMVRAQQIFTQGAITTTGVATDLALSGDGFFAVAGSVDGQSGQFYTRAGQFQLRADGTVINPQGLELQGYAALLGGGFESKLSSINIPTSALPPRATTTVDLTANLDATEPLIPAPWDPQNPGQTSNHSTSITVYDSLGNAHALEIYFRKTGANTWEYHGIVDGDEVSPPQPGLNVEWVSGTLAFDTDGKLVSDTPIGGGTIDFLGATPGQAIALDFGDPTSLGGTGMLGVTQYGSQSNVSAQTQDGYASGDIAGIEITPDGVVNGAYSNGETLAIAQVAVAKFRAPEGLARAGHNLWMHTVSAGDPTIGAAGSGGRGGIVAGALEQSNVDLASQFVDMITYQRAFSANSKTITTADEMLAEIVNLKR
ncbi:MAG: flagellar hook protein FlgE [Myxococcales bacterium]|nr:flagellar hook protein FlgE [Myxococcales bacterium]